MGSGPRYGRCFCDLHAPSQLYLQVRTEQQNFRSTIFNTLRSYSSDLLWNLVLDGTLSVNDMADFAEPSHRAQNKAFQMLSGLDATTGGYSRMPPILMGDTTLPILERSYQAPLIGLVCESHICNNIE